MSLKFNCGYCDNQIIVKYLKIGEMALCKGCGKKTVVPRDAALTDDEPEYEKEKMQEEESVD
jgi:hypothetical protein